MLKLADNPAMLFPSEHALEQSEPRWFVAHVRSRSEKALAHDLARREVTYFLPMVPRTIFSGGRKRHGLLPLFPSYVFVCGGDDARYAALGTGRVCQLIDVTRQAQFLHELVQIHAAIVGGAELLPCAMPAIGQRCRISAGPFQGLCGTVISHRGQSRLVLEVKMIGQQVSMEVDGDLLERLSDPDYRAA